MLTFWRGGTAAAVAVAATLFPQVVRGQWPNGTVVVETTHHLARTAQVSPMSGMIADYGAACVYCHTSHSGSTKPLWNRDTPTGPYVMYDTSTTMDMIADPQPSGLSLACLSCHDSSIGLDAVLHPPSTFTGTPLGDTIDRCANCHKGANPKGGIDLTKVDFGTDFRDQHPFSILYDPSLDPDFRSVAVIEAAGIRLYDGKLQCASCHDPHSEEYPPFLRIDNSGGASCSVCHITAPGQATAHFW